MQFLVSYKYINIYSKTHHSFKYINGIEIALIHLKERGEQTLISIRKFTLFLFIFFVFIYLFIYLFIYGCVGSSFLCEGFL